jgi:hypothetical protein
VGSPILGLVELLRSLLVRPKGFGCGYVRHSAQANNGFPHILVVLLAARRDLGYRPGPVPPADYGLENGGRQPQIM